MKYKFQKKAKTKKKKKKKKKWKDNNIEQNNFSWRYW